MTAATIECPPAGRPGDRCPPLAGITMTSAPGGVLPRTTRAGTEVTLCPWVAHTEAGKTFISFFFLVKPFKLNERCTHVVCMRHVVAYFCLYSAHTCVKFPISLDKWCPVFWLKFGVVQCTHDIFIVYVIMPGCLNVCSPAPNLHLFHRDDRYYDSYRGSDERSK